MNKLSLSSCRYLSLLALPLLSLSCDRQKQAEIRDYTKDVVKDTEKAVVDARDKVTRSEEYKTGKLKIKGTWNETKGKLKQKYAELTDDDLLYQEGREDELYGRLQRRLGKSREEVKKILEE